MEENQEVEALRHTLQSCQSSLVCLENDSQQFLAFKPQDRWEFFEFTGAEEMADVARFLRYLINTEKIILAARENRKAKDYYSLNPLIYSSQYWLTKICPQEFAVHDSSEFKFALLLFIKPRRDQLAELVGRLGETARVGFVGGNIAAIIPFDERSELKQIIKKIGRDLEIRGTRNWVLGEEIKNTHELKSRVKKYND